MNDAPTVPAEFVERLVASRAAMRADDQAAAIAVQRLRSTSAAHELTCQEALAAAGLHPADGWRVDHDDAGPKFTQVTKS